MRSRRSAALPLVTAVAAAAGASATARAPAPAAPAPTAAARRLVDLLDSLYDFLRLAAAEAKCVGRLGEQRVAFDALVLGDLVRLESGQRIPADAVVVSGEASVNESLLTGEADEIQKAEGDRCCSLRCPTAFAKTPLKRSRSSRARAWR